VGAPETRGAVSVLFEAMAGEHERAAGAWHSEWSPLTGALALTGGAAAAMAEVLEGLEVRPDRMRANLEATGGLLMAESVTTAMAAAGDTGRLEAHHLVSEASARAADAGRPLREELTGDGAVTERLSEAQIDRALDPAAYLGAAHELVDRALKRHREQEDRQ
jgi:3-carboxy-cis,cis-muconate cycloisomerase